MSHKPGQHDYYRTIVCVFRKEHVLSSIAHDLKNEFLTKPGEMYYLDSNLSLIK